MAFLIEKNLRFDISLLGEAAKYVIQRRHSFPNLSMFVVTYLIKRGHGPDDVLYAKYESLRNHLPRGCADLFIKTANGDQFLFGMRGPAKFSGTTDIDEDADEDAQEAKSAVDQPEAKSAVDQPEAKSAVDQPEAKSAVDQPEAKAAIDHLEETCNCWAANSENTHFPAELIRQWQSVKKLDVSFQVKANGKFAIAAIVKTNNILYLLGGSKNMHVVHPLNDEIKDVKDTDLHWHILKMIQRDIKALSDQIIESIIGKTIIAEYVDGKHLVYTEKPYMVYFGTPELGPITEIRVSNDGPSEIVQNYLEKISIHSDLGKTNTHQEMVPFDWQLRKLRDMNGIEGIVIYYRNTETGEIYRSKHKTKWYIVWRSIREKIANISKHTSNPSSIVQLLRKRVYELSSSYVKLTDDEITKWYVTIEKFVVWLQTTQYDYKDVSFKGVGMAKVLNDFSIINQDHIPPLSSLESVQTLSMTLNDLTLNADYQLQTDELDPKTFLIHPELFDMIIHAATQGYPCVVIMNGVPGTGKSSVTKKLAEILLEEKISVSQHCTDSKFIIDGKYKFDGKLLNTHHAENFAEFSASLAQVRICDNTNLIYHHSKRYVDESRGSLVFMLSTHPADATVLAKRNVHGVDVTKIQQMLTDYKPKRIMYYGIFPKMQDITKLIDQHPDIFHGCVLDQKTPLHVTVVYVGGDATKDIPPSGTMLGSFVSFEAIGVSKNEAGWAIVVESKLVLSHVGHITLSTNQGKKPMDVGENINMGSIRRFKESISMSGILLPYYS